MSASLDLSPDESGAVKRVFDVNADFLRFFLVVDVIEEPLVDVDRDHFGRLLCDRESKVTGAGADVRHGLPVEWP
jgi:hypothetical protein